MERLRRLFTNERELRMVWVVEREGKRSSLVGTAHFFPFHFRTSLRRRIEQAEAVLFEGPLNEESAKRVMGGGLGGHGQASLLEGLDAPTIRRIQEDLGGTPQTLSSHMLYQNLFGRTPQRMDLASLKGLKPWMAFFQIWSHYLRKHGWIYNMELDALGIATELCKGVHFLETIDEQIEALDNVPIERFVHFLKHVNFQESRSHYLRLYLDGDLEGLLAGARGFPTFWDSIVEKRDPVMYGRMKEFIERGRAIVLVGAVHCRGIKARLLADGYRVGPPAAP
jgi:uncharacterized protein YbaP (TraB family)